MPKHFFTKPSLSRRETRLLEPLENLGISPIILKAGKTFVFRNALSTSLKGDEKAVVNDVEVPYIGTENAYNNL